MRLIEPSWSRFLVCQSHLCRDWLITCQSDGWMYKVVQYRVGLRMQERLSSDTALRQVVSDCLWYVVPRVFPVFKNRVPDYLLFDTLTYDNGSHLNGT